MEICGMTAVFVWMSSCAVNWHAVGSVQKSLHDKFAKKICGAEVGQQFPLTNVWVNTWELHVAQVSMKGAIKHGGESLKKSSWKVHKQTHIMLKAKTLTDPNKKNPFHQSCCIIHFKVYIKREFTTANAHFKLQQVC